MTADPHPPLPTQPAPVPQAQTGIAIYEGMRVYARGLALSAIVPDGYAQQPHGFENRGWSPHPKVPSVWVHARHPDHIAYRPAEEGAWRIVQRVRRRPSLPALQAAADSLAGTPTTLMFTSVFPRALRTVVRLAPDATLTLGTDPAHSRPFGPKEYREIEGHDVEYRLARTTDSSGRHTLYAEAFVSRNMTVAGEPRSVLFLCDGRHVLQADRANAAGRFFAQLLDSLFWWVIALERHGVLPGNRRLRLPQVAVAHVVDGVGDVFFDAHLPGPQPSEARRIATCGSGGFMPIEGNADQNLIFGGLAEKPWLLARPGLHSRDEVLAEKMASNEDWE